MGLNRSLYDGTADESKPMSGLRGHFGVVL